jgi:hypothetical protein
LIKPKPQEEDEEEEEVKPIMAAAPQVVRNEVVNTPPQTTVEVKAPIIEPEAPWEEKSVVFELEEEEEEPEIMEEEIPEEELMEESPVPAAVEEPTEDETDDDLISEELELTRPAASGGGTTTIQMDKDFSVELEQGEEELSDADIQRKIESWHLHG